MESLGLNSERGLSRQTSRHADHGPRSSGGCGLPAIPDTRNVYIRQPFSSHEKERSIVFQSRDLEGSLAKGVAEIELDAFV